MEIKGLIGFVFCEDNRGCRIFLRDDFIMKLK